jgi:phosphomannomutase
MAQDVLMVSISGLRGIVGRTFTPAVVARYAGAFAEHLIATRTDKPSVVIGCDGRPSGSQMQAAAAAALERAGCTVHCLGVATTPGVAIMVQHFQADGGIVITASHNPQQWNGLKLLRHDSIAPPPDEARAIIERFESAADPPAGPVPHVDEDHSIIERHTDLIVAHIDVEAIRARRPKVVLDSVCGAGGPETAQLLNHLGVELIHLHGEPTGQFPHTPEPTEQNLVSLCEAVREHGADLGLAQDPDADRLALVDELGRYIGEEYTLVLCARRLLARTPGPVATNLSTSRMIDDVAAEFGCTVYRTPVGEANVAGRMKDVGAVIGGEGNGGIIWPVISYIRDSLCGAALVLEALSLDGRSLSEQVGQIRPYVILKQKMPIAEGLAEKAFDRIAELWPDGKADRQDGLRIDLPDGWVHVRPSNTEPILRIIVEAQGAVRAQALMTEAEAAVAS